MSLVGLLMIAAFAYMTCDVIGTAIEKNRERAEYVADILSKTIILNGDGLSQDILFEANINSANAFFSITDDDKTNLLSCTRAKSAGCEFTVALINDPSLI